MARHLVALAAFFVQAHPKAPVLSVDVLDPHRQCGAHSCERKHHQRNQRPVPKANGCADIDAIEQLPGFRCIEHGRLALAGRMTGAAHGRGRIVRHDLADYEPVEEMPDHGEMLLDRRCRQRLRLQLDPGGHMKRSHGGDRDHADLRAPCQEFAHRVRIRSPRVWVADGQCEELKEPDARAFTGIVHQGGQRPR